MRSWLPLILGLGCGVLSLLAWYGFLASAILPKMYRPLHHWMYGLALLILGGLKLRKGYGKFSFATGSILFIDDFPDFLELFTGIF